MTAFDDAIAVSPAGPGTFSAGTHPAFGNFVGPFGGITAATIVHAIQADERSIGRPAALTLNFTGPLADGDYEIDVQPARTNNSNQHWTISVDQAGENRMTGTALFVRDRPSWASLEAQMPQVKGPHEYPVVSGHFPLRWIENYEMRFVEGPFVASAEEAGPDSTTTKWFRQLPARGWDYPGLAAAADVFGPRIFQRLGPVPAGTVTLTAYFHADAQALAAQGEFLLGTVRGLQFADGLADQHAQLWGEDGSLVATTTQLCYYKAAPQE